MLLTVLYSKIVKKFINWILVRIFKVMKEIIV